MRSGTSFRLGLVDEHEVGLADELAPEIEDNVPRRLDIHGTVHHRHEPLAQRHEIRRDVGINVAPWSRMNAGYPESSDSEEADDLIAADEREIEVARARTVAVERRAVF